jgi:CO dehydrogenase/acetyl-CoA synthase epsilon subunit
MTKERRSFSTECRLEAAQLQRIKGLEARIERPQWEKMILKKAKAPLMTEQMQLTR